MIDILLKLIGNGVWAGIAAIGFSIIFNVPKRTLAPIAFLAFCGTFTKFLAMNVGFGIIMSSFFGAIVVGFLTLYIARHFYTPPLIVSIPGVIPMVPGIFIYNFILGLFNLGSGNISIDPKIGNFLLFTTSNGLKAFFIIMGLAIGVAIPMILTKKESIRGIEHHKSLGANKKKHLKKQIQ